MDGFLTSKEAASQLGISVASLYQWLAESDAGSFVVRGQAFTIDYFQGGYVATQHLIHSGHKQIFFIQNTTIPFFSREILRGYLFAHDENGIQYSEELIYQKSEKNSEIEEYLGFNAVKTTLHHTPYSAVLTTEDRISYGVIKALKDLKIPNLRWPGGCFADTYHWKDAIGPKSERKHIENLSWGNVREDNSFGTNEFLNMCELLGAEPSVPVFMFTAK